MTDKRSFSTNRRDFLTGRAIRENAQRAGEELADHLTDATKDVRPAPTAGDTIRLGTKAMACDFAAVMNPGPAEQVAAASEALDLVHQLEAQMTVYRPQSELSRLNFRAAEEPVEVEERLFGLLLEARRLCLETDESFDPTSGPLIALWRRCRRDNRVPSSQEIDEVLETTGIGHVDFQAENSTVRFDQIGVELNLGGIGKGYALDRAGQILNEESVDDWFLHGGHSSLLARGDHAGHGGWPVGIRNPLFPKQRLATIVLRDRAMASSGSGVQFFRNQGKRYGHILNPCTGWPVEGMLSVTVLAPTSAEADALSTAFFVMGVENARHYCDNHENIAALLIPPPKQGRRLEPINCGIPDEDLFWMDDQPVEPVR